MKHKLFMLILICIILLSSCSPAASPVSSPNAEKGFGEADRITDHIRASELLIENRQEAAKSVVPIKNPHSALDIPTQITRIGDRWFIVDCYHDQIIYNDDLKDPLNEWLVMTDEMNKGHTLASDGQVYLADDTENERIMVFEETDGKFLFTQQFSNITSRPHYMIYDEKRETFFAWCSMSGEMYLFRHGKKDTRMYLTEKRSIPKLKGIYVRSFTIIGDEIYFVSGNKSIIKADLDSFRILDEYSVPPEMAGMVQLTKIGDDYYITISTDDKWDQSYATIIRCSSLDDLSAKKYEDIYGYFIGGGTPYYITEAQGSYYLTEHRIPGHSIWRFDVDRGRINAETIY